MANVFHEVHQSAVNNLRKDADSSGDWVPTENGAGTTVKVQDLTKRYGTVLAADHINLEVKPNSIISLLGPSGCGKTTTIRCIAGLERSEHGEIEIGGKLVMSVSKRTFLPPHQRNIGMVFQSYAVWPHMTVYENVVFPLKARKIPRNEWKTRVTHALELVRLTELEKRYASKLSGGQQQRLALARAIVYEPEVLLLDEPLSNLDAKLRESTRLELKQLQAKLGITTLYVTHDQEEALVISDTVCVMNEGRIVQEGTPLEIYKEPANRFVADFIGKTNFITATIESRVDKANGSSYIARAEEGFRFACSSPSEDLPAGERILVSIRPENIRIGASGVSEELGTVQGTIQTKTFLGNRIEYVIISKDQKWRTEAPATSEFNVGDRVSVYLDRENCLVVRGQRPNVS